jgi:hypothetical protein
MKIFWIVAGAGLALLLYGLTIGEIPMFMDVNGVEIRQWYQDQTRYAFVIGIALGCISAALATVATFHRPGEHSGRFASRVSGWGVATLLVTAGVVLFWGWSRGYGFSLIPEAAPDRAWRLITGGEFMTVLGSGIIASTAAFFAVTRTLHWGGRYALVRPRWMKSTSSRQK